MYFRGKKLTIENLSVVLEEYSRDVRDEVRSMIMDGIDLSDWIEPCSDNPFRLKQIRMSALEGLSPSFFEIQDGDTLYKLRKVIRMGFSGEELLPYVGFGFDKEEWDYLLNWYQRGYLDSRLQLTRTPKSMWYYLDEGMRQGLPMHIFTNSQRVSFSGEEMKSILQIMNNGAMYEKYLATEWNKNMLSLIARVSGEYWFKFYDELITTELSYPVLEGLFELAKENIISSQFLAKENGLYKYAQFLAQVDKDDATNYSSMRFSPEDVIKQWEEE